MKTKIAAVVVVVLGIAAIVLYSSVFVVEEGKQVVITEFGDPVRTETEAGLHYKTPFIQEVHVLEKRLLPWDGDPESMQTFDLKRIDIDVWARWKIVDPMLFFQRLEIERRGQLILDGLVNSAVRNVVAKSKLIDVVRNSDDPLTDIVHDPNDPLDDESQELARTAAPRDVVEKGRDKVEQEILTEIAEIGLKKEYGMELIEVHIKRVNYVETVRKAVYERMISDRLKIAKLFESEAIKEKNIIEGLTRKELDGIEGDKLKESAEIRGEADAQVIKMTAEAYGGEALEFYEFLRRLEVFKESLGRDTRLILSTESDLFRLLKEPGEPSLRPASPPLTSP